MFSACFSAPPRLRLSASSSISRTPRDPDPDGTASVSPCQGDCGRRLRAAIGKAWSANRPAKPQGLVHCAVSSLSRPPTTSLFSSFFGRESDETFIIAAIFIFLFPFIVNHFQTRKSELSPPQC